MKRARLELTALESRDVPATFTVKNLSDDGNTANSLRWCIAQANAAMGADAIIFEKGTFNKGDVLQMTQSEFTIEGELSIDGSLTSNDNMSLGDITIKGRVRPAGQAYQLNDRHFNVPAAANLTLIHVRLTGGHSVVANGDGLGGSIYVATDGRLSVFRSTLTDNRAEGQNNGGHGGAIYGASGSILNISRTEFTKNKAGYFGGGISFDAREAKSDMLIEYVEFIENEARFGGGLYTSGNGAEGATAANSGTVEIKETKFLKNKASGDGGGIYGASVQSISLAAVRIEENTAADSGGGLFLIDGVEASIGNATISKNTANIGLGGGLLVTGRAGKPVPKVQITNTTIGENKAQMGAGIHNIKGEIKIEGGSIKDGTVGLPGPGGLSRGAGIYNDAGVVTLVNTIISGNKTGLPGSLADDDVSGAFVSLGNNLIGEASESTGWVASDTLSVDDAQLRRVEHPHLGLYYVPLSGSPALDAGNSAYAVGTTDQRGTGYNRIVGSHVDIGAIEVGDNTAPIVVDDEAVTTTNSAVLVPVLLNDGDPEGDTLSVVSATNGTNGTVTVNPNGTVTYTPNSGFVGTDSFTYTVSDGFGGSATGAVNITVSAPPTVTLTGRVWNDSTANGVQDAGEAGVSGVLVQLLDVSGNVLAVAYTNSNGDYAFNTVAVGQYRLRVIPPPNAVFVPPNAGSNDNIDSDFDAYGYGDIIVVPPGGSADFDAGLMLGPGGGIVIGV